MKNINLSLRQFAFMAVLCMTPALSARQNLSNDADPADRNQSVASAIFNDIMLSLPGDMKAKVDSASLSGKCARPQPSLKDRPSAESSSKRAAMEKRGGAVADLPENVRDQVEKAIIDIDLRNKDRQIQFKEYEKKHNGSR